MALGATHIGSLRVSRLVLGGNPFSGISHQSADVSRAMADYYTTERIKDTLREAERLGINTFLGRSDRHIIRTLQEYWNEGSTMQWLAQTAPEYTSLSRNVDEAIGGGASAVYLHGGHMEQLLAAGKQDEAIAALERIRKEGLPAGIAGHVPSILRWAEEHAPADFYMCSYYNPSSRGGNAEYVQTAQEHFLPQDRDLMAEVIQSLRAPAIHYKVFAAGRNDPRQAFAYAARHLRPTDAVCIGVFTKDHPTMIAEDVALFEQALQA